MKSKKTALIRAIVAGAVFVSGLAVAAEKIDIGKQEYDASCAACHGKKGEGDGPYGGFLNTPVSNLTVLSKNNGGVFPFAHVYDTIDGRALIKGHGADMPIWGARYSSEAAKQFWDYSQDADSSVRGRILALIDYIHRLQQK